MCEQLRSIATARLGARFGSIAYDELSEVLAMLRSIIGV